MAQKNKKMKEVNNVQLRWNRKEDKSAIKALQDIQKAFGVDGTEALRITCVYAKDYLIEKAKQVKEVLKA